MFQGHENGDDLAYITRVNLDVSDPAHRITLVTPTGADGLTHFSALDGTTWDPFTRTLLFTQENGPDGGVVELKPDGSALHTLDGVVGKGSYEGIRVDDHGNLIIDEDEGGTTLNTDPNDPSSPTDRGSRTRSSTGSCRTTASDLSAGGVLQALQVTVNGTPVIFHPNDPVGDTFTSQGQLKINTPGTSWPVRWVTLHNTAADGFLPFDANAAAKAAGATPFKRPENGGFLPGQRLPRRTSSTRRATRTRTPATTPGPPTAAPGRGAAHRHGLAEVRTTPSCARSSTATPPTTRSTTSRSRTGTRCSSGRTGAMGCTSS